MAEKIVGQASSLYLGCLWKGQDTSSWRADACSWGKGKEFEAFHRQSPAYCFPSFPSSSFSNFAVDATIHREQTSFEQKATKETEKVTL